MYLATLLQPFIPNKRSTCYFISLPIMPVRGSARNGHAIHLPSQVPCQTWRHLPIMSIEVQIMCHDMLW